MRIPKLIPLVCVTLVPGLVACRKAALAPPTAHALLGPSASSAMGSGTPQAGNRINALVRRLSDNMGLWTNGSFPKLDVGKSAKTEEILAAMYKLISFDQGNVTSFQIVEEREVIIPPDTHTYRAASVTSNQGPHVVLMRHDEFSGWWTRAY